MQATQVKELERVLDRLVEMTGGNLIRDENITKEGNAYILPEKTTFEEDVEFLQMYIEEQEEGTGFSRQFNFKVWDVAYATSTALRTAFGALRHTGTWLEPPSMVDIPSGPHTTVQVPFGQFIVPALPRVQFSVATQKDEKYGTIGIVSAYGPKKHKKHIESIFDLIEMQLNEQSLYRGKAFTDDDKPEFIDTDAIDPSKIVYSEEVQRQIATNVYVRLDHPEVLADLDIKFKSAILLEGEFGVGKTEALNLIAKRAVEAKRPVTFIKVKSGGDLMQAMQTARMYAPSVVAYEDVDGVASAEGESEVIREVLEAFDGQQAKLNQVMVLMTTNFVETLHKGLVRPGRIDAIIPIGPPDAAGIQKLVEVRTPPGLLSKKVDWKQVAEKMDGYFPSFVVEATTRAMRHAVQRLGGPLNGNELTTEDLVGAAIELRRHFDLHRDARTTVGRPDIEKALVGVIRKAVLDGDDADGISALQAVVEEDGDETRRQLAKRSTALAQHTAEQAEGVKQHNVGEHEVTREVVEENA